MHTYGQAQVRVSCGHLCEAEAPTEPVGEIYLPLHFFIQIIICRGVLIINIDHKCRGGCPHPPAVSEQYALERDDVGIVPYKVTLPNQCPRQTLIYHKNNPRTFILRGFNVIYFFSGLIYTLLKHCFCNLFKTCNISTCDKVIAKSVTSSSCNRNIIDILH